MEQSGNLKPTNKDKQTNLLEAQLQEMRALLAEKDKEIQRLKEENKKYAKAFENKS